MCHAGAVSNHISISVCVCVPVQAAHGCAWLAARAPVCTCLCLQPAQQARGGGCMVCSENYFSTATGLIMVGPVYFPTLDRPCHCILTKAGRTGDD